MPAIATRRCAAPRNPARPTPTTTARSVVRDGAIQRGPGSSTRIAWTGQATRARSIARRASAGGAGS